jgi:hypothetical protein
MTLRPSLAVDADSDEVTFTLAVENAGDDPVEFTFRSGQQAEFVVSDDDGEVWRFGDGRMFTQALRDQTVQPGETVEATAAWADPDAGEYTVGAWLTAGSEPGTNTTFSVP